VAAGAGLVLTAGTHEPWQLYLGVGLLAGVGLTPLRGSMQCAMVPNWFAQRRGLAGGIVVAGTGFGTLLLAPATQWVIDQAGWRAACLVLGALFLLGIAPLNVLWQRHRPTGTPLEAAKRSPSHPPVAGPTVGLALRQPRFWALGAAFGLGAVPTYLLYAHGVAHLVDVGFARDLAVFVLGLSGAATVGGTLLWGHVADRWSGDWAYTVGMGALVAGVVLLALITPGRELLVYAYAVLFAQGLATQGLIASDAVSAHAVG
jgi:predicted MFS family arabinose efflux permease